MTLSRYKDPEARKAYEKEWRARQGALYSKSTSMKYYDRHKDEPEYMAMKREASKVARRKKKYGITREGYCDLLTQQNGACMICNSCLNEELRVDHDHKTGEVRGLLCANCNAGIGFLKESPAILINAIEYIRKYSNKQR